MNESINLKYLAADFLTVRPFIDAWYQISHDPDGAGNRQYEENVASIKSMHDELFKEFHLLQDDAKASLIEIAERFFEGYKKHLYAWLRSMSRTASTFITGPANFPVARMEKRNAICSKRLNELCEYKKKIFPIALGKARALIPADIATKREESSFAAMVRDKINTISQIDSGELRGYTRALFVSSLVGRVETACKNGDYNLVALAKSIVKDWIEKNPDKKEPIAKRNSFWNLKDKPDERDLVKASREPETIYDENGIQIVADYVDERARIFFNGKPDQATINALKSSGWRWSPSNQAWQRILTSNAKESAKRIVAELVAKSGK